MTAQQPNKVGMDYIAKKYLKIFCQKFLDEFKNVAV